MIIQFGNLSPEDQKKARSFWMDREASIAEAYKFMPANWRAVAEALIPRLLFDKLDNSEIVWVGMAD